MVKWVKLCKYNLGPPLEDSSFLLLFKWAILPSLPIWVLLYIWTSSLDWTSHKKYNNKKVNEPHNAVLSFGKIKSFCTMQATLCMFKPSILIEVWWVFRIRPIVRTIACQISSIYEKKNVFMQCNVKEI